MMASTDAPSPAIPAATLIVMRDIAGAEPEILMVERAKAMVFAGGAMVFPGGRIDPADEALAEAIGTGEDGAARIAAIRETIEEAGLAIGLNAPLAPESLFRMRVALHDGQPFAAVLQEAGVGLALNALTSFARWRPAHAHMRIFDTRFYLARCPDDAPEASVDHTENSRLTWASARQVLADADAGKCALIFPTRRNLERLARYASYSEAVAQSRETPVRTVTPWEEERDGVRYLCIPEGLGYPVTSERLSSASRG